MDTIVNYLKLHGIIDDEDVAYFPDKYPFTKEEFREFTDLIEKGADFEKCIYEDSMFPSMLIPWTNKGEPFYLFIMNGQGSSWTLFTTEAWDEHDKYLKELNKEDIAERKAEEAEAKAEVICQLLKEGFAIDKSGQRIAQGSCPGAVFYRVQNTDRANFKEEVVQDVEEAVKLFLSRT